MANLKQSVDKIVNQPMDRKEFLASAGAVALTLFGVTAVLKSFDTSSSRGSAKSSRGYGTSPYGR